MADDNLGGRYAWYALSLLFLANVFNYMDRMVISVLLPSIKADLNLSDTQLGLLTGIAFAAFYAILGIPIARWADRGTRRSIIAAAIAVWSVMTVVCGMAQNFIQLMLARFGVGIGEAGCIPPSHSLIADYFTKERRSTAYAIHLTGSTVGVLVGLVVGGLVGEALGWRWAFFLLGIPGLVLAVIIRLTLREPPRGATDGRISEGPQLPLRESFAYLFQRRTYVHLLIIFSIISFAAFGMVTWLPSYYQRSFDMSIGEIGFYFGIVFGSGAAIGTIGGGLLADWLGKGDLRKPLLILGTTATLLNLPLTLGMLLASTSTVALSFNFASSIAGGLATGALFAALQAVVGNHMRALAVAIMMFSAAMLGIGLGPLFVGMLSDFLRETYGKESLRYALITVSLLGLYPFLHLILAIRSLQGDIDITDAETKALAQAG